MRPGDGGRDYRHALGSFATGITVVTCALPDGRRDGLTVNSFTSVSLEPPLVSWCLGVGAVSFPVFDASPHFAVNVLALDQQSLVWHFASRREDKFAEVDASAGLGGAPLLDGCVARFECRRVGRHEAGDHVIYLGEVERYARFEGEPLVHVQGRYGRLDDG
ncbi:MAG: flavin reductase [Alphaproteobacteria bacterium]|jgi:flavin reductase (DIM6/NTAB) family NADH-FMN oxidoreductase RutF|nr:flavin reductase [Alphaproteobacteria bacterium]